MDTNTIVTLVATLVFAVVGYLFSQRDKQRGRDTFKLETQISETARAVAEEKERVATRISDEKEKTAALVLSENRLNTALVLAERDKLAEEFKKDYKELDEKFVAFRIKIAEEYATTVLVEKILNQVTSPIIKQLGNIEIGRAHV